MSLGWWGQYSFSICYYGSFYFTNIILYFPASLYQSYKNFYSYIVSVLILFEVQMNCAQLKNKENVFT